MKKAEKGNDEKQTAFAYCIPSNWLNLKQLQAQLIDN